MPTESTSQTIKSDSGGGTQTSCCFKLMPEFGQSCKQPTAVRASSPLVSIASLECGVKPFGDLLSNTADYGVCSLLWPYLVSLLDIRNVPPDICSTKFSVSSV